MSKLAPVVLFAYRRPDHLRKVLESLAGAELADQTMLYIYLDGLAPGGSAGESEQLRQVHDVARERDWCGEVSIHRSSVNQGLRRSIVNGVTEVVNRHGSVIVLEDDIVVSRGFLKFVNQMLTIYEAEEEVMQIAGSSYDAEYLADTPDTYFLRALQCHGWATWKRAWDHYNDDALDHLTYFQSDPQRAQDFDVDGSAYFLKQLQRNVTGELKTWAVRWYASWLRAGGTTLFPKKSLVTNIGFDATGTNCGESRSYLAPAVDAIEVEKIEVKEDLKAREAIARFWRSYLAKPESVKRRSLVRRAASQVAKPLTPVAKKIARKALTKLFPELKPLLQSQGAVSWTGVVSSVKSCRIAESAKLFDPVRLKWCIVGEHSYLGRGAWASYTEIGKFCSIGPNFKAGWGIHPTNGISTSPSFYSANPANLFQLCKESKISERKKITIGNDVFIGMNVTVLDGVTIGDGAVVGAGCVVSKVVPPYAIVVGNPMRILRHRFGEEMREKLREINWWDWPEGRLAEVEQAFFDVQKFVERCVCEIEDVGSAQETDF
ncbi:CatB-related O-acetyltransferase [Akkermansiaceae bacterium]|nr:CatB-related O-acetyltransferase [Akkermansiaceae bacterium]